MDPIRTLLLARTYTVVLDPDLVANAATRPVRDADVDRFEDELLQLGFVMSLDLAMTVRRLPHEAMRDLKNWMIDTLARTVGAHRPQVPLFRRFTRTTPDDTWGLYRQRMLTWLHTRAMQPCPWCGQVKTVGALDPCGHLVCRACWDGGTYTGCPICHRRVALTEPFVQWTVTPEERVQHHAGELRVVHLALDPVGVAKARFERLMLRQTPIGKDDRAELEVVIDALGPRAAAWLPARIPVRETMALAVARLWLVAADRAAMVAQTQPHVQTATDVLRIATVLMGGDPALVPPVRLRSLVRSLRRAVLDALERLPVAHVVEDLRRHASLWKRVGERLHPFEYADRLPNVALAFATVRGTDLARASFGAAVRARAATVATARVDGDRARSVAWAGPIETALARGDVRAAAARLGERPGELLRRVDHLARVTVARAPDALGDVLDAIRAAIPRGAAATLLTLGAHVARRGAPWPRRVVFPKGEVLRAWGMPDRRAPLPADVIGAVTTAVRAELLARAAARRHFARAVLDRDLAELPVAIGERSASAARLAWPRGSHVAIPDGATLRLFLHWEEPAGTRVDLDLSVALFDEAWQHVGTCDFTNLVVGTDDGARAAVHSGDLTSAPPPLGATELVDLDLARLAAARVRHAVMVVFSYNAVSFDRLTFGFAGLMQAPAADTDFDPRAVVQRFDLFGRSVVTVPLAIDLATRRLTWLDVHASGRGELHQVGGYRAALAHLGRDFADLTQTGARPTLWDVAALHAAARANVVYVRDGGAIAIYKRRDHEPDAARLARLHAGDHDGVSRIPPSTAPTFFALVREDLVFPRGSEGYALDRRGGLADGAARLAAGDLVAQLAPSATRATARDR